MFKVNVLLAHILVQCLRFMFFRSDIYLIKSSILLTMYINDSKIIIHNTKTPMLVEEMSYQDVMALSDNSSLDFSILLIVVKQNLKCEM